MGKRRGADGEELDVDPVAMASGLAQIVAEHGLSELILATRDVKLTVRRANGVVAPPVAVAAPAMTFAPPSPAMSYPGHGAPAAAPVVAVVEPVKDDKAHVVTSPFVGTFYRRPNPDSPSYVSLNDKVEKGAVLCIVEAMKLMNEIEADVAGTVVGILVEDGAPVEYGQPLFRIS